MSFVSRLRNAAAALFPDKRALTDVSYGEYGKSDELGFLPPTVYTQLWQNYGIPPPFRPGEVQQAYSDNPWLYAGINVIANEVARTNFKLVRVDEDGDEAEAEHQAMETLR